MGPDADLSSDIVSARMLEEVPLMPAEQRVRSAFAQEGASAAQGSAGAASLEEFVHGLSFEEHGSGVHGTAAMTSTAGPATGTKKLPLSPISVLPPSLPATVPPPPLQVAVVPMAPAHRDSDMALLTARPLQSIAQRTPRADFSWAPHSDRSIRDAQSLAALRMVR